MNRGGAALLPLAMLAMACVPDARGANPLLELEPRAVCKHGERWQLAIRVLGIRGADAEVVVPQGCNAPQPRIRGEVRTARVIRWAWRVNDTFETLMDGATGRTLSTEIHEDENGTVEWRVDRYVPGAVSTEWHDQRGIRTTSVPAPPEARDPFTVLLLLRGQALENGVEYRVPIFSKDTVYDGRVVVVGRTRLEVMGVQRPVVHLRARFLERGRPSRVRADIYLTDDEERLPARVQAGTRFGFLVSELVGVSRPAPR